MHNRQLWPGPPLLALPAHGSAAGVFWRPNPAFIAELVHFLRGKTVLEIFAGNGFLAALLAREGIAVTATSVYSSHDAHSAGFYHPVAQLNAVDAVALHGAAHDVLLVCWPTVSHHVLRAARQWGSAKDIIYVGEVTNYQKPGHLAGCATDEFFEAAEWIRRFDQYRGNMLEAAAVCRVNGTAARPERSH